MINITHAQFSCPSYRTQGIEQEKVVAIGPVKIFEDYAKDGAKSFDLVIGCNMFLHCENLDCAYSSASRMERRRLAEMARVAEG